MANLEDRKQAAPQGSLGAAPDLGASRISAGGHLGPRSNKLTDITGKTSGLQVIEPGVDLRPDFVTRIDIGPQGQALALVMIGDKTQLFDLRNNSLFKLPRREIVSISEPVFGPKLGAFAVATIKGVPGPCFVDLDTKRLIRIPSPKTPTSDAKIAIGEDGQAFGVLRKGNGTQLLDLRTGKFVGMEGKKVQECRSPVFGPEGKSYAIAVIPYGRAKHLIAETGRYRWGPVGYRPILQDLSTRTAVTINGEEVIAPKPPVVGPYGAVAIARIGDYPWDTVEVIADLKRGKYLPGPYPNAPGSVFVIHYDTPVLGPGGEAYVRVAATLPGRKRDPRLTYDGLFDIKQECLVQLPDKHLFNFGRPVIGPTEAAFVFAQSGDSLHFLNLKRMQLVPLAEKIGAISGMIVGPAGQAYAAVTTERGGQILDLTNGELIPMKVRSTFGIEREFSLAADGRAYVCIDGADEHASNLLDLRAKRLVTVGNDSATFLPPVLGPNGTGWALFSRGHSFLDRELLDLKGNRIIRLDPKEPLYFSEISLGPNGEAVAQVKFNAKNLLMDLNAGTVIEIPGVEYECFYDKTFGPSGEFFCPIEVKGGLKFLQIAPGVLMPGVPSLATESFAGIKI